MSKVSIVVPIYNAGKYLDKCIKSILNQTFKDLELVLVNDGSTDNSLEICKKHQKQDQRIILINKNNEGSIITRRNGIESSKSDYIMFVDADDWVDKEIVETLYTELKDNDADISVCNMYKVLSIGILIKRKNDNQYFKENKLYEYDSIKNELIESYLWGHTFPSSLCAKLYKKEVLLNSGKYLDSIRFLGDDLFYNLEILLKSTKVKVIDKPLYYYRQGGFTSKFMPYLFDDMVNGYIIQKSVINEHFKDSTQKQYNGISMMLVNTFKTCLYNLFNSDLEEECIKSILKEYCSNENVKEAIEDEKCQEYFDKEFLSSVKHDNVNYLYELGKTMHKKSKPKKNMINLVSKLFVV